MTLRGVVPVREIAEAGRISHRCAKRRLQALERRHPGILVQFAPNGHYFADLARVLEHMPGLVAHMPAAVSGAVGGEAHAKLATALIETRARLDEAIEQLEALRSALSRVREDTQVIRAVIAA